MQWRKKRYYYAAEGCRARGRRKEYSRVLVFRARAAWNAWLDQHWPPIPAWRKRLKSTDADAIDARAAMESSSTDTTPPPGMYPPAVVAVVNLKGD